MIQEISFLANSVIIDRQCYDRAPRETQITTANINKSKEKYLSRCPQNMGRKRNRDADNQIYHYSNTQKF